MSKCEYCGYDGKKCINHGEIKVFYCLNCKEKILIKRKGKIIRTIHKKEYVTPIMWLSKLKEIQKEEENKR